MVQEAKTLILNAFRTKASQRQSPIEVGELLTISNINSIIGSELMNYRDDALRKLVDEGILIKTEGNSETTALGSVGGYRITELGVSML